MYKEEGVDDALLAISVSPFISKVVTPPRLYDQICGYDQRCTTIKDDLDVHWMFTACSLDVH
jgi:hypothetical protein